MNENMMKRLGDPKYDEDLVNKRYVDKKSTIESNGEYFKFPDGTLICKGKFEFSSVPASSGTDTEVTLPSSFIDNNYCVITQLRDGGSYWSHVYTNILNKRTNKFTCRVWNNATATSARMGYDYIAIGKWK